MKVSFDVYRPPDVGQLFSCYNIEQTILKNDEITVFLCIYTISFSTTHARFWASWARNRNNIENIEIGRSYLDFVQFILLNPLSPWFSWFAI